MIKSARNHEVHEIALQTGFPEEVVDRIYEDVLQSLAAEAHIKEYLHLLTSKHVRRYLKDMRRVEKGDQPVSRVNIS